MNSLLTINLSLLDYKLSSLLTRKRSLSETKKTVFGTINKKASFLIFEGKKLRFQVLLKKVQKREFKNLDSDTFKTAPPSSVIQTVNKS